VDNWKTATDVKTVDSGWGLHYADLPTSKLPLGGKVLFTFFWSDARKWEGTNWEAAVVPKNA
jgi:glucoamylase